MLLRGYTMEIFKPECNPHFESVHCFAHLENDISRVMPYLNAVFGGTSYQKEPPSVMLQIHGRLVAIHARKIAINALKDRAEAEKIVQWLMREINETWEKRDEIVPTEQIPEKPKVIEVLRLLPKTNCQECGQPTCMVFSTLVIQGVKEAEDCPALEKSKRELLEKYLKQFNFIELQ